MTVPVVEFKARLDAIEKRVRQLNQYTADLDLPTLEMYYEDLLTRMSVSP